MKCLTVALASVVLLVALSSTASAQQDGKAERQAAAWKALVDQIASMDPADHTAEKFGAFIFGNPGDKPPMDKRQVLCTYVLTQGTQGHVPVEQISRASRLCTRR
jgi:hypothetical protein